MITEDYVSFETAKLLKEKGFDENCAALYDLRDGAFREKQTGYVFNNYQWDNFITAPTLQMAMKWLREVHKMFIQVELYSKYEDYCFELFQNTHRLMVEHREVYSTYEEACESAIKYCLENLI